jgi:phospholipid transport system transporter-binding protein
MLVLPEVLTLAQAGDTLRMLEHSLLSDNAPSVTVDASSLASFDSAAVAVLLECRRLAQAWNKGFALAGVPPKLAELMRLYGVDGLLNLQPDTAAQPGA